jgi:AAA+ ATPase superfamily predicted ATPase
MEAEGLTGHFKRNATKDLTEFFCNENQKTGLCYLRGRRRVGKSTLLKDLSLKNSIFYYSGKLDELLHVSLGRFAKEWSDFSGQEILKKIKITEMSWDLIFDNIVLYAKTNKLMLALDEIQWIAKSQNGFIGTLKNKWIDFEKTQNIRLVICGSSNKFFKDFTGGEEQILRGLKTRSDIVLQPFSMSEVYKYYLHHWRPEEVIFAYMTIG